MSIYGHIVQNQRWWEICCFFNANMRDKQESKEVSETCAVVLSQHPIDFFTLLWFKSEMKIFSRMNQDNLVKKFPLYLPKQMGEDQLDNL